MVRVSFRHSKLVQLSKSSWQYLLLSFVSSFLNTTLLHKNAFFWSSDAPRVKKSGIFGILTKFHRRWSKFYLRHAIFWPVFSLMKLQKISVDEMRGICASALERLEAIAEAEGSNCEWLFVKHYFYVYMEHLLFQMNWIIITHFVSISSFVP